MLIPAFILLNTIPHFQSTQVTVQEGANVGKHVLSYQKLGNSKITNQEFADEIVQKLFNELWKKAGKFESWPHDTLCINQEKYSVTYNGQKREICSSKTQFQALGRFQSQAALILSK